MSDTIFQSAGSVTTVLGMLNQFNAFCNLSYLEDKNTTLNAKYNVNPSVGPSSIPTLNYFGIGIGGYKNTDIITGARAYQPKATNMDLYIPIPIRMVPVEEDLTAAERVKYRLKVQVSVGGQSYYQYWLKKIIFDPNHVRLIQKLANGVESNYILNPEFLSPEPPELTTGGVIDTNENRVIVAATGVCEITGTEVLEAVNLLYGGDLNYARISEFGFYTGEDRPVNASGVIQPIDGVGVATEAVYVQLAKHRCTLGSDMSDSGTIFRQLVNFEHTACIEI